MLFRDRAEAGKKLSESLLAYKNQNAVVYALARGGIATGVEISIALELPLDLVIARKIGHPMSPEYPIAAVTQNGEVVCRPGDIRNVDQDWLKTRIQEEKLEAKRRAEMYMKGRKTFDPAGRLAILVDDGIATGLTMEAAIRDLTRRNPSQLVLAVPVGPAETMRRLCHFVDNCIVLFAPEYFAGALNAYYDRFPQLTDADAMQMLNLVSPRDLSLPAGVYLCEDNHV